MPTIERKGRGGHLFALEVLDGVAGHGLAHVESGDASGIRSAGCADDGCSAACDRADCLTCRSFPTSPSTSKRCVVG